MPEGVTAVYDSNFALVTVATPTVEEEPTAAAATTEAAAVAVSGGKKGRGVIASCEDFYGI